MAMALGALIVPAAATTPGGADVPPPAPDVVPQPPSPAPPPRPQAPPPDVIDPALPGEHAPVREPGRTPVPQSV